MITTPGHGPGPSGTANYAGMSPEIGIFTSPTTHLRALGTILRGEFSHRPRIRPTAAARAKRRIQARRLPGLDAASDCRVAQ